jgi:hypothetical protein
MFVVGLGRPNTATNALFQILKRETLDNEIPFRELDWARRLSFHNAITSFVSVRSFFAFVYD